MNTRPRGTRIERVGPADLMFLAVQGATVPEQFGVVLELAPDAEFDPERAVALLADRVRGVPRLRQRVLRVPPGCGRPIWVDDPTFRIERHVDVRACPWPADEAAVLDAAAELLLRPMALDRPLWAARLLTGLAGGRVALVVVVQHALGDGLGGLAVLGALVDGSEQPIERPFPMRPPSRGDLVAEAFATRARALARLPRMARQSLDRNDRRRPRLGRPPRIGRAPDCALMRPTGPRRTMAVATSALEPLRATAHECGATVNDALASAIAGALHAYLRRQGEDPPAFLLGVPVAVRPSTSSDARGNAFTETRALVPGGGQPLARLPAVAAVMRERKGAAMSTAALLLAAPTVRAMVATGVYGRYMRRQRYLHTVLTNVRGPDRTLTLAGATVARIVPLSVGGGGNVTVTFAALSYAGTLFVTVTADPASIDLPMLAGLVQAELDALHAAHGNPGWAGPSADGRDLEVSR